MSAYTGSALLVLYLLIPTLLPAQGLQWRPGDQWHYELRWTIDAPEMRGPGKPPSSVLAYPVFKVLEARDDGFTLSVRCDSARVVAGPTGRNGDGLLLQYQLEYIFRTDRAGRLVEITNLATIEGQMLRALEQSSFNVDPPRMIKEFRRFPNWEEAFFLREYDFIFDAYGHVLKPGEETPAPAKGKRFYHLTNTVPMEIAFADSMIGTPTVMQRTMTRTDVKDGIRIAVRGVYEQPAYEYKMDDGSRTRYEPKKGYYRAEGLYDDRSGRFLEGELIFGTTGGKGTLFFASGNSMDMPEQRIEERRTIKSFTPKPAPASPPVVDLPGIPMPVFPTYQEVVYHFYQHYKGNAEPNFKLAKSPDGYRITRLYDYGLPMFEPELIWSPRRGWLPVVNFNKPEPVEPGAPDRLVAVYDPSQWKEEADWYLRRHAAEQREYDRQPFAGYPGFYTDVIALFEPRYQELSNEQLHSLARAYAYAAAGLLHNNSGLADSTRMFRLPPGQNALTDAQAAQYTAAHDKAVNAYALLAERNPAFPTPIGTARTKYGNEVMDGLLTLRYFQNEQTARRRLRPGLYGPQLLQYARNLLESCPRNAILITNGDSDTYPLLYLQIAENVRPDVAVANASLLALPRYYQHLLRGQAGAKPLATLLPARFFERIHILQNTKSGENAGEAPGEAVAFLQGLAEKPATDSGLGYDLAPVAVDRLALPPAPPSAAMPGMPPAPVYWKSPRNYVGLDALALLDMVAANRWSRPLCFAPTCAAEVYAPWQGHLAIEGMVYRVFASDLPTLNWNSPAISADKSLDLWRRTFRFDAQKAPLTGETSPFYQSAMLSGLLLAADLQQANRCTEALAAADVLNRYFADEIMPRNLSWIRLVEVYAACGQPQQAEKVGLQIWDNFLNKKFPQDDPAARIQAAGELDRIGRRYDGVEKLRGLR